MVLVMKGKVGEIREVVAAAKPVRVQGPLASVYDLYRLVADHCGIEFEALVGPNRYKDQVRARQLAVMLVREVFPSASLTRLGSAMNRDHSTVLHNLEAGGRRLTTDAEFRADLEALREKVEEIGVRKAVAA
jgi:chromosomal replication initiator protein